MDKDFGMSTVAYASLMVELQQGGYTSKTRESRLFEGNQAIRFVRLGVNHYLVVLYFPASACQSHLMYLHLLNKLILLIAHRDQQFLE